MKSLGESKFESFELLLRALNAVATESDFFSCHLFKQQVTQIYNPIKDGHFLGCSRVGGRRGGAKRPSSLKSVTQILQWWNLASYTWPKEDPKKYINLVTHPLSFAHFFTRNHQILLYQGIQIRLQVDTWFLILFTFHESFRIVLINMVTILLISARMATPGLLKIKVFWNKDYDVIVSGHDVTNKILSLNSNYIVDVAIILFGNSSISMRRVIMTSIL